MEESPSELASAEATGTSNNRRFSDINAHGLLQCAVAHPVHCVHGIQAERAVVSQDDRLVQAAGPPSYGFIIGQF